MNKTPKNSLIIELKFMEQVAKKLRDIRVKLEPVDKEEFNEAILESPERTRIVADSFGYMLSQDLIKEVLPLLNDDVDIDAFSEAFSSAVGRNKLVDFDESWAASIASIVNTGIFSMEGEQ